MVQRRHSAIHEQGERGLVDKPTAVQPKSNLFSQEPIFSCFSESIKIKPDTTVIQE
jgi:hypothetical protein